MFYYIVIKYIKNVYHQLKGTRPKWRAKQVEANLKLMKNFDLELSARVGEVDVAKDKMNSTIARVWDMKRTLLAERATGLKEVTREPNYFGNTSRHGLGEDVSA